MKIVAVLLLLVAVVLIHAANRPDTFRLQRALSINASLQQVFAQLNDFHHWPAWSPWVGLDPQMQSIYSGAAAGTGAVYEWRGNNKVGAGRMEIIEITAPGWLKIKLDFLRPMVAHNITEFALAARDGQTHVTWAMYGPSPYLSRLMTTFISMDRLVGKDFERGLARLKAVCES